MANFSGKLNLLGFKGAKVFSNLDPQHPNQLFVAIPVGWNDIQLSSDGKYANAGVYIAETNDKFRQACVQRKQMSGDDMTGYAPPSHQVEVSFSKEFRDRALQAAKRRIIAEHPEWQGNQLDEQFNQDLRNAMYDAVRCRLGSLYSHQRRTDGYQPSTSPYQQAQQPMGWLPGSEPQGYDEQADDLPF